MTKYTVLRDLAQRSTRSPDAGVLEGAGAGLPSEPAVDIAELTRAEVRDLSRDQEVRAIAPVMPTQLIEPFAAEAAAQAAAGNVTWGVTAVGADTSTRTGAGVVVAVLDTGIDRTHTAFTGVQLVEEDFSGSGIGDKQGHGTHCAGTIFGRDVNGLRIGVARGVTKALIGKVLDDNGQGDSDMIFRGIQWAAQNGAQVISMSLGFNFPGMVKALIGQGMPAEPATSTALEAYRSNLRMFDSLMAMIRSREPFGGGTVVCAAAGNESKRASNPAFEIAAGLPAAARRRRRYRRPRAVRRRVRRRPVLQHVPGGQRARGGRAVGQARRRPGRPERHQHGDAARGRRRRALVGGGARLTDPGQRPHRHLETAGHSRDRRSRSR